MLLAGPVHTYISAIAIVAIAAGRAVCGGVLTAELSAAVRSAGVAIVTSCGDTSATAALLVLPADTLHDASAIFAAGGLTSASDTCPGTTLDRHPRVHIGAAFGAAAVAIHAVPIVACLAWVERAVATQAHLLICRLWDIFDAEDLRTRRENPT
ncbi:MAG: hypothetical protein Tsb0020_16630 [Haliangiales bacterium]